jgi:hypothetical protein
MFYQILNYFYDLIEILKNLTTEYHDCTGIMSVVWVRIIKLV